MRKNCPNVKGLLEQGDTTWSADSVGTFLIGSFDSKEFILCNAGIYHKDASA